MTKYTLLRTRQLLVALTSLTFTTLALHSKDLGSIWMIGDSITQGNADGDPESTPRSELYKLFKEKDYEFNFMGHHNVNPEGLPDKHPQNRKYILHSGVSGIKIGAVKGRLGLLMRQGNIKMNRPSLILIMLGTNDIGGGDKIDTADQRLKELVQTLYAIPKVGKPTVLLATIPPNRRKEADRTNVILFNGKLPAVCQDLRAEGINIHLVDHFKALDDVYEKSMMEDNLHPNGEGNKIIAQTWLKAIEELGVEKQPMGEAKFPGERGFFKGYETYSIREPGMGCEIIAPDTPAEGKPWLWRSIFWHAIDRFNAADLKLVDEGYHVVLCGGDVAGHPNGNKNITAVYDYLTKEHGFHKKMSMGSMSRGTLATFRWATENPDKVASIYVDNGVLNVLSWPAGQHAEGNNSTSSGDKASWVDFKKKFGYETDAEALKTKESPIDLLEPLAKHNVPIISVCGSGDKAVPYEENDALLEKRYKALGGDITVIIEKKGHSHGMADPTPVLEFIRKSYE